MQASQRLQSSDDCEDAISSTDDGSQPISQNVQDLANDIYKEFESLIKLYGHGFLHNLMPLVIRALENLDSLHSENSDLHLKSLVLSDDHRLLSGEYEKEKKLRKVAENKLFRLEDDLEEERKQHEEKTATYDANIRVLENRVKSLSDQISRFEEQETEMKKEYQRLHGLYTNLLRAYLEYVERVRSMFNKGKLDSPCLPNSPYPGGNTCFGVEMSAQTSERSALDQLNRLSNMLDAETLETERQKIMRVIMETTPELYSGERLFNNSSLSEPCFDELSQGDLPEDDGHDIKSHDGSSTTPQPQSGEPLGSEFAEPVELEIDGDITDYAGVRREIQNLIKENQELIQTKNALKVVTNDLIGRIDELSCQNFQFSSELNALITNRASMLLRIKDLEQENGQLRREFENSDLYGSVPGDETLEGEDLPLSMRFRFSRIEMARVLLERNQYKEQLLELQEAVQLTHNLKNTIQQPTKLHHLSGTKRGRIRNFFARLFNSSQSDQMFGKLLFTQSTSSLNNSQSSMYYNSTSSTRLNVTNQFTMTSSPLLKNGSVNEQQHTSVLSSQSTINECCTDQYSMMIRNTSSLQQACVINDLNNSTELSKMERQPCSSPIQWYSHKNEPTLDRKNVKVAYIYPLDNYPSSLELRCATVAYLSHPTSHSSAASSPTMSNSLSASSVGNRLESPSVDDDHSRLSTSGNANHESFKKQKSRVENLRKSMNNQPSDQNSDYSMVIDDQFSDAQSNIIWLSSFSMKHGLTTTTTIKAPSSASSSSTSSTSSSSSTMFTGSDNSTRIKSLISIVRVDQKSCQLLDSFAICSSTVLCICSVPEVSIEDLTSLDETSRYWEMLPMDTFSDDSEINPSLNTDLLEMKTKKHNLNTPLTLNECNINTELKFLECVNTNNNSNNTPQKLNQIIEEGHSHRTSTPTSHLSSIKQTVDHLSSTRRLINALGIVGSVNDVDEVTMSYVATRRRFLIRQLNCDTYIHNNDDDDDYVVQASNEAFHNLIYEGSHLAGQVFVSLANGQLVVFRRHHFHRINNNHHNNASLSHSISNQSIKQAPIVSSTSMSQLSLSSSTSSNLPDNNNNSSNNITSSEQSTNTLHYSHQNLRSSNDTYNQTDDTLIGTWNFTEACVITCGRPQCSISCTITVPPTNSLWTAYRNRILVINAFTLQLDDCFKVYAIQDAQIQTMSWYKDGVWISIRRESILRLYHVISHELIQTVDLNQIIMNLMTNINLSDNGNISTKLKSTSSVITTLKSINDRLWIGTSAGFIVTMHFQDCLFNRTFQQTSCERQQDSVNLSKRICKAILDCSSVQTDQGTNRIDLSNN
ncbi:unnamed protein product [Schistosoma turkestanicum]|nr:unnamed protein product [Schistosoma turkestanicum]